MYGTATTITAHPSLRQETILLEREVCLNDQGGMRMGVSEGVSGTLRADMGGHPPIVLGSEQGGTEVAFDLCPTLTASAGMSGNNRPVLFENHSQDGRYRGPLEVAPTLQASCGMGGNNQPFCVEAPAYGISGTVIGRGPENGGNGAGVSLEVGYTLTARDRHGVCVPYQRGRKRCGEPVCIRREMHHCPQKPGAAADAAGVRTPAGLPGRVDGYPRRVRYRAVQGAGQQRGGAVC